MNTADLMPVLSACMTGASRDERIRSVAAILATDIGRELRHKIGHWIVEAVGIDRLIPPIYENWRPLVRDAIEFIFASLSEARLAAKIVDQFDLPMTTTPARRLLRALGQMPGIQKLGQVLARHRELDPALRSALSELENGMRDAHPRAIRAIIAKELGPALRRFAVKVEAGILSEASVSAVIPFVWRDPGAGERERGVFKVIKPGVRALFAEDLAILQKLGDFVAQNRSYGFATHYVAEMVAEVRSLLEHELDFAREQHTLMEVRRTHEFSFDVRIPHLIEPLSTAAITAMSREDGVKVTDAFARDPNRRRFVTERLIEALVVAPLLSRRKEAIFHADPHAGNLLYNERTRELVMLDWALTDRLSRETRRHLAMLVVMTMLRNAGAVAEAIRHLATVHIGADSPQGHLIAEHVDAFFAQLTWDSFPGAVDALRLLDGIALEGVRFPAALAMFQKSLFTLDGMLHDIGGSAGLINCIMIRDFVARAVTSFGLSHPPFTLADIIAVQRAAILYPLRFVRLPALEPVGIAIQRFGRSTG